MCICRNHIIERVARNDKHQYCNYWARDAEDGERVVGTASLARASVMIESSRNAYMISQMGKIEQGVFLCTGIDWLRLITNELQIFLWKTLTQLKYLYNPDYSNFNCTELLIKRTKIFDAFQVRFISKSKSETLILRPL